MKINQNTSSEIQEAFKNYNYIKNKEDDEKVSLFEESQTEENGISEKEKYDNEGCTDGNDDGKIGFWEGLKSVCKGIKNTVKEQVGSLVSSVKEHPIKTGLLCAGAAVLCVLGGPIAVAGLSAVGAVTAGVGIYKGAKGLSESIKDAKNATTDAEKRAALEDAGSNGLAIGENIVLGVTSAASGLKAINAAKTASSAAAASTIDDAAKISAESIDDAAKASTSSLDDAAKAAANSSDDSMKTITTAKEAEAAGHKLGRTWKRPDGEVVTFDKSTNTWLKDPDMAKFMNGSDDIVKASTGSLDDAAKTAASSGDDIAKASTGSLDDAAKTAASSSDDSVKTITTAKEAEAAGHKLGRTWKRPDGEVVTFDKSTNTWLKDPDMAKFMNGSDDIVKASTDSLDDAAKTAASSGDDIAKASTNSLDDAAETAANSSDDSMNLYRNRINSLKQKYRNGQLSEQDWNKYVNEEYSKIRKTGKYRIDYGENNFSDSINNINSEIIHPSNQNVEILNENGWAYRANRRIMAPEEIGQRMSLNVKGNSNLLKEMDRLMTKGEYIDDFGNVVKINVNDFYYKTYQNPSLWGSRVDPITIYFKGNVNQETFNAIKQITKSYARGTLENAKSGSAWMIVEESPSTQDIYKLISIVEKYSPGFARAIDKHCSAFGGYRTSSGMYKAYLNILNEFIDSMKNV